MASDGSPPPTSVSGPKSGKLSHGKKLHALPGEALPRPLETSARRRRKRLIRLRRAFALWVGLPTLLAGVYYSLIATPQYESITSFTIQSVDSRGTANIAGLLGGLAGPSSDHTLIVRDYILSRDMLAVLASQKGLLDHYRGADIDRLSRLTEAPTQEEAFEYYLNQIEVVHDTDSGVLTVTARAFDADTARDLTLTILTASESMVNKLSEKAQRDAIGFAEKEIERAQAKVARAREALLSLQDEGDQFNPLQDASAVQQIIGQLEGEQAKKRAELRAIRSTMGPSAPEAIELRQHVASLDKEIRDQRSRLVDVPGKQSVSASIARFEPAILAKEFALRQLNSALTSMELARVDASRQHRYLAVISNPSMPDAPTYPDPLLAILRVFVLSMVVAALGGVVVASIREHAKV